jgi:chemotaxis protein CheD
MVSETKSEVRSIFIGQRAVSTGAESLAVHGLGSCVALILFEPRLGWGGLAHVLLPGDRPPTDNTTDLPAKYAVPALDQLAAGLQAHGANPRHLRGALVGGARMFESDMDLDQGVGQRNAESLRTALRTRAIPLALEDTGGNQGRTVVLHLPSCVLRIRTLRGGWVEHSLKS